MARSEAGSFWEGTSDPSESPETSEGDNSDRSIAGFDGDPNFRDFDLFYGDYFDRRPRGPQNTTLGTAVARAVMQARVDAETTHGGNSDEQSPIGEPLAESTVLNILEDIQEEEGILENIPERLHNR